MGLFSRKAKPNITSITAPVFAMDGFELVFEVQNQPSAGMRGTSWETLQLDPRPIFWTGIPPFQPTKAISNGPQLVAQQTVRIDGLPIVSGQIIQQPLYDPSSGYSATPNNPYNSANPYNPARPYV